MEIKRQVWVHMRSQAWERVWTQVSDQVESQAEERIWSLVGDQLENRVWHHIMKELIK